MSKLIPGYFILSDGTVNEAFLKVEIYLMHNIMKVTGVQPSDS